MRSHLTPEDVAIKRAFEYLCNAPWGEKKGVILRYIDYLRAKRPTKGVPRELRKAEKRLAEVDSFFERNPHKR